MKFKKSTSLVFIVLMSAVALWGCPKKAELTSAPEEAATAKTGTAVTQTTPGATSEAEEKAKERTAAAVEGLKPIYFDFDRYFIRDDEKPVMKANAEWLKAHPTVKIKLEGNCDERGTIEYNQALGQRRSASAKKYLTDMGVSSNRISLISYGKEKPICTDHNETCWQKNRRDEFIVVSK
jgi:peptidoglycan-associated lipoprotein